MFGRFVLFLATAAAFAAAEVRVVDEIAAKVNGDVVTKGDLQRLHREAENELRSRGAKPAQITEALKDADQNALRDEIDKLLLVQKAKDYNISVEPEITRWIATLQVQARTTDPDKFAQFIQQQFGMTLEELKQRQREQLLTQRVIGSEVGSRIYVPPAELQKYYDEHKSEFVREEQVFLSQILLSTEGKSPEQTAEAEKKAKDLVARARQGEKFSELASANSDDQGTARNGGYLGPAKKTELRKEIADLVFNQKRGYVTDPIKLDSPSGFLILKVEERHESGQATFEEVKDQIQQTMAEPQMGPKIREFLSKLRRDAFLEIRKGYADSAALPDKDTSWKDVAELKPETVTKEEVAARRRRKLLWIIPYKRVGPAKTTVAQPAPEASTAQPNAPAQK
jgi:peptidyl-prolyl cis-trans isomerase SurA